MHFSDTYHARPNPTGKVNRRAYATQKARKADVQQRIILGAMLVVVFAAVLMPHTLGWPALFSILGLALWFKVRSAQWAKWEPYTKPETGEMSWRPTKSNR
jgi:hypothetical protein